jgi:hypothetical protein
MSILCVRPLQIIRTTGVIEPAARPNMMYTLTQLIRQTEIGHYLLLLLFIGVRKMDPNMILLLLLLLLLRYISSDRFATCLA